MDTDLLTRKTGATRTDTLVVGVNAASNGHKGRAMRIQIVAVAAACAMFFVTCADKPDLALNNDVDPRSSTYIGHEIRDPADPINVPSVDITDAPTVIKINVPYTFVATASDPNPAGRCTGEIVRWDWDFGDGTTLEDASSAVQHTFAVNGTYTVTVTVTDNDGNEATCSKSVLASDISEIRGVINTSTLITACSPYHVTGTVTIPSGNTLTIEAGVDVLFDADVQFIVQGAIHAHGSESDSVRFVTGAADMWRGIRISGGDSSSFAYTRISDANARGDSPDYRGGGLYMTGSGTCVSLKNCTVSGNTAYLSGGIYIESATATLTNCTIDDNTAVYGGGIYGSSSAIVALANCTIGENTASVDGGGVYNSSYATATLTNCILWQNAAPTGPQIYCGSGTVTARYSDIQDGIPADVTDGGGNINADPLFFNPANGDFRLSAGSPCIDTGDPASPKDPDGTRADMGAIPYQH